MSLFSRLTFRSWLWVPCLAGAFLVGTTVLRWQRVDYVTGIAEWSVSAPTLSATSATGYAEGVRRLIVPGHNNNSYQWIMQTQQMVAGGDWRLRHVSYDNAPQGRVTHAPAGYRWWLGAVAQAHYIFFGGSWAAAVERAALLADPLSQLILLVTAVFFTARWFRPWSAALLSVALVALFPLAADYFPGAPDQHGWLVAAVLGSVLPLLAGGWAWPEAASAEARGGTRSRARLFFAAGVIGGLGLWLNAASQAPILVGLGLSGLVVAWMTRTAVDQPTLILPWRSWAAGGALTSLLAYLLEYFPSNLTLRLEVNHPLYALAWWATGEVLGRFPSGGPRESPVSLACAWGGTIVAALVAGGALITILVTTEGGKFIFSDPLGSHLSQHPLLTAPHLFAWLQRDGLSFAAVATMLPWLLIVPAIWQLGRGVLLLNQRVLIVIALGPVCVAGLLASQQLRWFSQGDAALVALLVALTATRGPIRRARRWGWAVLLVGLLLPGVGLLLPAWRAQTRTALTEIEVAGIIERDLAHWLAQRSGGQAVVLAPPDLTTAFFYHGGLRGLGTLDWENEAGLKAAIRIASATSPEEALALLQKRGVTHIVIPSWDTTLDAYARLGSRLSGNSFMTALNRWVPLGWLRPLPYHWPKISGFEEQSVVVLEVGEEQDELTALIHQAGYFVEMGRLELAAGLEPELQRFPADLGARVAWAQIEAARGNAENFKKIFNALINDLRSEVDQTLPWDQRVNLLAVLMHGDRADLAQPQVSRCLAEATEERVRALTSGALFRLLALSRKFNLEIADPALRELAFRLLPPSARDRVQR